MWSESWQTVPHLHIERHSSPYLSDWRDHAVNASMVVSLTTHARIMHSKSSPTSTHKGKICVCSKMPVRTWSLGNNGFFGLDDLMNLTGPNDVDTVSVNVPCGISVSPSAIPCDSLNRLKSCSKAFASSGCDGPSPFRITVRRPSSAKRGSGSQLRPFWSLLPSLFTQTSTSSETSAMSTADRNLYL